MDTVEINLIINNRKVEKGEASHYRYVIWTASPRKLQLYTPQGTEQKKR